MQRKSLSDILAAGNGGGNIRDLWNSTDAADENGPLPPGEYIAHVERAELFTSRRNETPGVKLTFRVCDGEFAGRRFFDDVWLTPAALPLAKRDLSKLGITSLEQLERPLPQGIRCKAKVVIHRDDDGNDYNRVRRFDVIGIDPPERDAFAPDDGPPVVPPSQGEGTEPNANEKPFCGARR